MDIHELRNLLHDGPHPELLEAMEIGSGHELIASLLEAELQRSANRLQRLKEYRNAFMSPVYRLQPEIVSQILYIYAQDSDELFSLGWTRVLLVCRRWHDIAISTSLLWGFINVNAAQVYRRLSGRTIDRIEADSLDVRRIEMQRSRAGLSPLTLKMELHSHLSEAKLVYTSMYWNPSSLYSLNIKGDYNYLDRIARALATHQHTILRTLNLRCSEQTVPQVPDIQVPLGTALRENMPQLSHLLIGECPFDWASVRGLRSLRVSPYAVDDTTSLTLQEIVDVLHRCPQLEIFAIALPRNFDHTLSVSTRLLLLPLLGVIAVQAPLEVGIHLFHAFSGIPSSTRLLMMPWIPDAAGDSPQVVSTLASYMGSHAAYFLEGARVIQSLTILDSRFPLHGEDDNIPPVMLSRLGVIGLDRSELLDNTGRRFHNWYHTFQREAADEFPYLSLKAFTPASTKNQTLRSILRAWPLSNVLNVDLREAELTLDSDLFDILFEELAGVATVVMYAETSSTYALVKALRAHLRDHGRRIFANLVFDAEDVDHRVCHGEPEWSTHGNTRASTEAFARRNIMLGLLYCEEASCAGVPLDTVVIFNEPHEIRDRVVKSPSEVDWSDLYKDLQSGFVYEGVLHSRDSSRDGRDWDFLSAADR